MDLDLTTQCAWCGRVMRQGAPDALVTHGICPQCVRAVRGQDLDPLQAFIERLAPPILVLDHDGVVVTANTRALDAVGKDLRTGRGIRGGDFMECTRSRLPGGCGNTIHCAACTIRNTVMATHTDGRSRERVEAFQEIATSQGPVQTRFHISTERVGPVVLLRIDDMAPAGPGPD